MLPQVQVLFLSAPANGQCPLAGAWAGHGLGMGWAWGMGRGPLGSAPGISKYTRGMSVVHVVVTGAPH